MNLEFFIIILFLFILVFGSKLIYGEYVSPPILLAAPLLAFYLIFLLGNDLLAYNYRLSSETYFLYFGSIISFVLGCACAQMATPKKHNLPSELFVKNYNRLRILGNLYFWIGFLSFIILLQNADYSLLQTDPNQFRRTFGIPFISLLFKLIYVSGWLSVISIARYRSKVPKELVLYTIVVPICIGFRMSKGDIITYILTAAFFYHYYTCKLDLKRIAIVALLVILIVVIVPVFRTPFIYENVVENYRPDKYIDWYLEYGFNYTGASIKNVELAVSNYSKYTHTYGLKLLDFVWEFLNIKPQINTQFGAYTGMSMIRDSELGEGVFTPFMISLFQDFGFVGVVLPFVFGVCIGVIYHKAIVCRNVLCQAVLPVLSTSLLLSSIDNFFTRTGPVFFVVVLLFTFLVANMKGLRVQIALKRRKSGDCDGTKMPANS